MSKTSSSELAQVENQIENNLLRYSNMKNIKKRVQGVVKLTEIGIGKYQYKERF